MSSNSKEYLPIVYYFLPSTNFPKTNISVYDLLVYLCIFIATVWCFKFLWNRKKLYSCARKVKGPFALPIIGSALTFLRHPYDIFLTILEMIHKYPGGIFRVWLGTKLFFVITEPKYVQNVFTSQSSLEKAKEYRFLFPILGEGLLISPETAMGIKVNAQTTNCKFSMWIDRALDIIIRRSFTIFYHSDIIFGMSSNGKELNKISKEIYNFVLDVIKEKKKNYKNRRNQIEEHLGIDFHEDKKRYAFLDHIIELSEREHTPFTDEQLIGEVNTFIFGQRVYDEIVDVLGTERPVERSDLSSFKYLERVIKETLRLFPAAPFGVRAVTADIDLGDYIIPEGSSVGVLFYQIHREEKYWPDPLKFDPDRFLPEGVAKRHPCSFLSFSYGPRNCIGAKYGIMSTKTLLATVLRKYKIYTAYKNLEEIELQPNIMLRMRNGYKVSFEPRKHLV